MVNPIRLEGVPQAAPRTQVRGAPGQPQKPFASVFSEQLQRGGDIRFSGHAAERMRQRCIELSGEEMAQVGEAINQAASKGARESLFIMDRVALVVSVPNRTVITAVPSNELGNNVFTNIDSAVIIASDSKQQQLKPQGPAPARGGLDAADRLTRRTA